MPYTNPEDQKQANAAFYARRKALGKCTRCGEPSGSRAVCPGCNEGNKARKVVIVSERKTARLCVSCRKPTEGRAYYCPRCQGGVVRKRKARRFDIGLEILGATFPGRKCSLEEIAIFCVCTPSNIQRIEREALKKLRLVAMRETSEAGQVLRELFT